MAVDMFLKITGVEGESHDKDHKNQIDILSFSWGVTNHSRQSVPGRVSPARKTSLQDFSIVKYVDKASPSLFVKSCEGEPIPEVYFSLARKETKEEYFKIKLTDVLISSVAPSGAVGGGMPAIEQVSFSFAAAEIAAADGNGTFSSRSTCGGSDAELPPMLVDTTGKK